MPTGQQPSENSTQAESDSGLWLRLQEQMEALRSQRAAAADSRSLAERLAQQAETLRQRIERPRNAGAQVTFLAFNKRQERYGIALDEVAAVESLDYYTPVPNAANYIRGVTPWRGAILSLVDLGLFFGRPEAGIADLRACVIVEAAGRRLAVVAYEVEEIFSVAEAELAEVPDLGGNIESEWIIGVHDENRLILNMSEVVKKIAAAQ